MTHILVVGGTGAMGSRVIRRLLATTDATITVPTRHPESAHAIRLAGSAPGRVRLVASNSQAREAGGAREARGVREAREGREGREPLEAREALEDLEVLEDLMGEAECVFANTDFPSWRWTTSPGSPATCSSTGSPGAPGTSR